MAEWSIEAFRAAPSVRSIVVAVPPGLEQKPGGAGERGVEGGDLDAVEGGATRAQSVANALGAVRTGLVAIQDAARPLVTPDLIEDVVAALLADPEADGAIAATPVTDTIKQARDGAETTGEAASRRSAAGDNASTSDALFVSGMKNAAFVVAETVERHGLWAAQTPQVFRVETLREALAAWSTRAAAGPGGTGGDRPPEATDEAMLIEAAGGRVLIHPAPPGNLKVTTPLDLAVAESLLPDVPGGAARRGAAARRG